MTRTAEELEKIRAAVGLRHDQLTAAPLPAGVIPLEIHCRWSACAHGHHTLDHYHNPRSKGTRYPAGHCQACGERVADLPRDGEVIPLDDDQFFATFELFPKELIRAHYWNVRFDIRAFNQALRLGRTALLSKARDTVIDVMLRDDAFSRRRAPYKEKIIAYAQHATATCCRQCAAYWHGLPVDMSMRPSDEQLEYVASLTQAYLDLRFPELPAEPTFGVPRIAKDAGPDEQEMQRMEDDLLASFARDVDPVGLVIPMRSRLRLIPGRDSSGGYVEPTNIELPIARIS